MTKGKDSKADRPKGRERSQQQAFTADERLFRRELEELEDGVGTGLPELTEDERVLEAKGQTFNLGASLDFRRRRAIVGASYDFTSVRAGGAAYAFPVSELTLAARALRPTGSATRHILLLPSGQWETRTVRPAHPP